MSEPMLIRDVAVWPGEAHTVRLPIARLPIGSLIDIPVYVFRGKLPGPTLLLQGGLHGDELNGVEILRRMLRRRLFRPKKGTVIVVPLLNVYGFLHMSREAPDGRDVNRMFPGSKTGSLAGRLVYEYMQHIFSLVDCAVDFHTGGKSRANHPQIRYSAELPESRALAEAFRAPFVFATKLIPRSLRQTACKRGVPVIVYEAGESSRFDEGAVEQGIAGARRVMAHLGISGRRALQEAPPSIHLGSVAWSRARRGGLFRAAVTNGERVVEGQPLGYLADPFGQYNRPIKATADGWVISVNNMPVVNVGDPLVRLGFEGPEGAPVDDG